MEKVDKGIVYSYREYQTTNSTSNTHDDQNSKQVQNITVGDTSDIRNLGGLLTV